MPCTVAVSLIQESAFTQDNYYVAALNHMLRHPPFIDGLYLDGGSFDRHGMRRIRRVIDAARPDLSGLIDLHGANTFDVPQTGCCRPVDPTKPGMLPCDQLGAVCKGPWSGLTSSALAYMDM